MCAMQLFVVQPSSAGSGQFRTVRQGFLAALRSELEAEVASGM